VHGITVSAFSSVSLDPPLVAVCIGTKARACAMIAEAGRFGVSILAADQRALSDAFAGRPDAAAPAWDRAGWETPVLSGALARLDCRVAQAVEAGDHVVFIGTVDRIDTSEGAPLAYWRGRYRALAD
jgi:flavin reductase (DIM6/NTAB) family NADH-FMN oxidoreductase RutF